MKLPFTKFNNLVFMTIVYTSVLNLYRNFYELYNTKPFDMFFYFVSFTWFTCFIICIQYHLAINDEAKKLHKKEDEKTFYKK